MSAIVQYAADCFIWIGIKLSEVAGGDYLTENYKKEGLEKPVKRNWISSYFGQWPISFEHGGIVFNIDPIFVIILSSISSLCCVILLWFLYGYIKRVWLLPDISIRLPEQYHIPLDVRDNNYNAPPNNPGLSPNSSAAVSEIPDEIASRMPVRLCRRPAAVNIQPNYEVHVPPVPRSPYNTPEFDQDVHGDHEEEDIYYSNLSIIDEEEHTEEIEQISESGSDNEEDIGQRSEFLEESDEEQRDTLQISPRICAARFIPASEYLNEHSTTVEDDYHSIPEGEIVQGSEYSEEPESPREDITFYDIPEEETSDDSSSQTEYDRFNDLRNRTSSRQSNPEKGDYKRDHDDNFGEKVKELFDEKGSTLFDFLPETQMLTPVADRVVLHQFQRGRVGSVPCLAPFAMKLETYLRMAEIEYDVVFDSGSAGPWLSYHGEDFKGVSSCIHFLKQIFPSQTEHFLPSPDMKVVSWFITVLVEYHLYWELIIWRWILNEGRDVVHNQPNWNLIFPDPKEIGDCVRLGAQYHGFGHLSYSIVDIKTAIINDLEALSESLGDKDFLTGSSPKEADCSAFAILSQMLWSSPDPFLNEHVSSFENILCYCKRMKSILWADWDDSLSQHEEFDTSVATYNSSAEVTPLASPRSSTSSHASNRSVDSNLIKNSNQSKTFTENQYWNINNTGVCNIPNSLNVSAEEYFDENLEDMESIKMESNLDDVDPGFFDSDEK